MDAQPVDRPRPRAYPTGAAYAEALQNTGLCFADPELRGGSPALTRLGLPRPISGAFASVFTVTSATTGRKFAVKCFTREVPDQADRYRAISALLSGLDDASLSQPWKMGFEYLPRGVLVNGRWYPVLKMAWVDGVGLTEWLDANIGEPAAVRTVADNFAALAADLADAGIAHGDFQHGNLLVAPDRTLRLVDYDGMFVPALAGRRATENGHRNYQSPMRTSDDFGPDVDRFSAWLIHVSLLALAAEPDLWERLHEPGGEYLLLTEDDLKAPDASARFPALTGHPDPAVRRLADELGRLAVLPLGRIPELDGSLPVPPPAAANGSAARGGPLPDWMTKHSPGDTADPTASPANIRAAGGGPVARPVPTRPTPGSGVQAAAAGFHGRGGMELAVVASFVLGLAATVVALLLFPYAAVATVPFSFYIPYVSHQSRPEVGTLEQRQKEVFWKLNDLGDPNVKLAALAHERRRLQKAETSRVRDTADRHQELDYHLSHSHAAIRQEVAREAYPLQQELDGLDAALRAAQADVLTVVRDAFVQQRLRQYPVDKAGVPGVSGVMIPRLAAFGIRTAADFTGLRRMPTTDGPDALLLVCADGSLAKPLDFTPAHAEALMRWRDSIERRLRTSAPTTATAADVAAITARFAARRTHLEAELVRYDALVKQRQGEATTRVNAERARLGDEDREAKERFRLRALDLDRETARNQALLGDHQRLTAERDRLGKEIEKLSFARYLRFTFGGS
ncbi:hypothetical protein [Yinghuangia seranimata]|uniref:hypothetical protein n=1 Tax=Yinghuangia seranimata TaxID=408067 RepID=UPI00248CA3EE|nr:hypothetical protein [Yinghuangia seranimata]MDI2132154.1 hypothetical protein [Yinghuangia seranimata]